MKTYSIFIVLYLALSFLACQDSKDAVKIVDHDLAFYRNVGEQISMETAMLWKDYYEQQNSKQGRLGLVTFSLSADRLNDLLESVNSLVGIAFHYGIDENGITHIIAIPVDETLSLWTDISDRIYVDTNNDVVIEQSVASEWAQNYKDANEESIWFHFFGETTFDEINAIPYFDTMEISPAINILNLRPQLLLTVWDDLLESGRTQQEKSGITYDASYPCPPCSIQ